MSDLPETVSVQEQAQRSGMGKIRAADAHDDIDDLKARTLAFIDHQGTSRSLSLAKTKLEEMIFWLRNNRERG